MVSQDAALIANAIAHLSMVLCILCAGMGFLAACLIAQVVSELQRIRRAIEKMAATTNAAPAGEEEAHD